MVISKAPSRLKSEGDEEQRDEAVDPGALSRACTTPNGPSSGGDEQAEAREEHDDSEAEDDGLHYHRAVRRTAGSGSRTS